MARGVNKVILIGNFGNDPEVRYTSTGNAMVGMSLATSETWKDKQTGDLQERTEWHRIVFFGRLAEIVGEYLRKGSKVYVEGSLRTRKWQDKSGADRYTTEIVANEMQMLDNKVSTPGLSSSKNNIGGDFASREEESSSGAGGGEIAGGFDTAPMDDDIPF